MRKLIEFLRDIKIAIFDLDGVIYRGKSLIKNVDKVIQDLKSNSIKVVYNTNNSTITRDMYVDRLNNFNIPSIRDDFYTSASITAKEITTIKPRSSIYVIGEIGLKEELKSEGHKIISENNDFRTVDFVVVGLDRDFHYKKIAFAQKCILHGNAQFYATNADPTLPIENGELPGAGVMVEAIVRCTDYRPKIIFGKPNPLGINTILKDNHFSAFRDAVVFGDRLNTDMVAGRRANIKTVLVLTGVTTRELFDNFEQHYLDPENWLLYEMNESFPDLAINNLDEIFLD